MRIRIILDSADVTNSAPDLQQQEGRLNNLSQHACIAESQSIYEIFQICACWFWACITRPAGSWGTPRPPGAWGLLVWRKIRFSPRASRASRGLLGPPGASRGLPGSPGASWGLPGSPAGSRGLPVPPGASRGLAGPPAPGSLGQGPSLAGTHNAERRTRSCDSSRTRVARASR